jgi:hypothetical protein
MIAPADRGVQRDHLGWSRVVLSIKEQQLYGRSITRENAEVNAAIDDGGAQRGTSSRSHGGRHRRLGHLDIFERSDKASAGLFVQFPMWVSCEDRVLRHRDRQPGFPWLLYPDRPRLRTELHAPVGLRLQHFGRESSKRFQNWFCFHRPRVRCLPQRSSK